MYRPFCGGLAAKAVNREFGLLDIMEVAIVYIRLSSIFFPFIVTFLILLSEVMVEDSTLQDLSSDAKFKREKVGDMPTEMFFHFFKSLADSARMNLNIYAEGENEHHKIEGIFKAFARAVKMAIRRDIFHYELPSTKGTL